MTGCELRTEELAYFAAKGDAQPKGAVPIAAVAGAVAGRGAGAFFLKPRDPAGRTWLFKADTVADCAAWMAAVNARRLLREDTLAHLDGHP